MPSLITLESLGYFISLIFYLVTSFIKYVPYQLAPGREQITGPAHPALRVISQPRRRRSEFLYIITLSTLLPPEHHEGERRKKQDTTLSIR